MKWTMTVEFTYSDEDEFGWDEYTTKSSYDLGSDGMSGQEAIVEAARIIEEEFSPSVYYEDIFDIHIQRR